MRSKIDLTTDKIILEVIRDLNNRSIKGIKKYGITLERKDLTLKDWLQHAYEECLDQANYLKRSILELESNIELNTLDPNQQKINFDEGEE
jgi:DNA-directed RNA polymerase beta' subunit